MLIALLVGLGCAFIGWQRAKRRGGHRGDRLQYAAAHGIPGFLISLILITLLARMGYLG